MSEKTKARVWVVGDFVLSCVWHVFAGLYEWIKYVAAGWASEWAQAKTGWAAADALKD